VTDLAGRRALVTGSARGIGARIAQRLAADGATVVLTSRSASDLKVKAKEIALVTGHRVVPFAADLRDPDEVSALAARVTRELGGIDILVNNAGVAGPSAPLWQVSPAEWDDTFAANVRGVFLACRAFVPGMLEQRAGSVITIGSITGKRPLEKRSPYAAGKAALIGLTRTLAAEVGPYGIRVNLVSPGAVAGERIQWVIEQQASATGRTEAEVRAEWEDAAPLHRLVQPEEVAATVAFLASDASSAITGQDLNVANGLVMS
jgi:NAD(P)-dependent dehydrogenase (short-subunit alcohol dehydrogenase family)